MSAAAADLLDLASYADGPPHALFRQLRAEDPVHWQAYAEGGGLWAVMKYADVVHVSRDPATFSSYAGGTMVDDAPPPQLAMIRMMMLNMDPPQHTKLRLLVNKGFTPSAVARLQQRVGELAARIVDAVASRGSCDFVAEVAGELPSYVIAELLGIPLEDGYRLYELTEIMNTGLIGDKRAMKAGAEMFGYSTELVARKRADPRDDIATSLLHAEVDGQRLTESEFNFFFMLLINAGGDTTRNLVAGGMCALMDHPEERAKLEAEPSLLPTAVEELLRYVGTFIAFLRTATKDTELRGVPVKEGDRVAMFYPSANRDEAQFVDPDRFDVTRKPNPHLAFGGGGTHFCLGANLARVEAAALVSEVLSRMKNMELAGPIERMPSTLIAGIHSMPVRFTPARRMGAW